jgi:hypothetical protein
MIGICLKFGNHEWKKEISKDFKYINCQQSLIDNNRWFMEQENVPGQRVDIYYSIPPDVS